MDSRGWRNRIVRTAQAARVTTRERSKWRNLEFYRAESMRRERRPYGVPQASETWQPRVSTPKAKRRYERFILRSTVGVRMLERYIEAAFHQGSESVMDDRSALLEALHWAISEEHQTHGPSCRCPGDNLLAWQEKTGAALGALGFSTTQIQSRIAALDFLYWLRQGVDSQLEELETVVLWLALFILAPAVETAIQEPEANEPDHSLLTHPPPLEHRPTIQPNAPAL
jgi:hypothetical protein